MKDLDEANLEQYLDKLEQAIDLDWERGKFETWKRVLDFEPQPEPFVPAEPQNGADPGDWPVGQTGTSRCAPPGKRLRQGSTVADTTPSGWPKIGVNEAIRDMEKMLLQQLSRVYRNACVKNLQPLAIRCNYGTGILPSLFGAEPFWMDDELDTLPTNRPLEGPDAVGRLIERGVPDLDGGFGGKVFETAEFYKEVLSPYPGIREAVWIYHPDLQGPIDVVELLWGSPMYYAFYEEPQKVKDITGLVTETYVRYLRRWFETVPEKDPVYSAHWDLFHKGRVMLRDDSIVNLSPEMYQEFVKPYDDRILAEFGGGAIHFCGKADHCIDLMTDSEHLTLVNMSQPEMNDMERIHAATVGKGVILNAPYREETMSGLDLRRGVVIT